MLERDAGRYLLRFGGEGGQHGGVGARRRLGLVAVLAPDGASAARAPGEVHGPVADVVLREVELRRGVSPKGPVVLGVAVGGEDVLGGRLVGVVAVGGRRVVAVGGVDVVVVGCRVPSAQRAVAAGGV